MVNINGLRQLQQLQQQQPPPPPQIQIPVQLTNQVQVPNIGLNALPNMQQYQTTFNLSMQPYLSQMPPPPSSFGIQQQNAVQYERKTHPQPHPQPQPPPLPVPYQTPPRHNR